jgi:hypothetical protein
LTENGNQLDDVSNLAPVSNKILRSDNIQVDEVGYSRMLSTNPLETHKKSARVAEFIGTREFWNVELKRREI